MSNNIAVDVSGAIDFNFNNGLTIEDTDPIYVNVKGDIMQGNLNMNNNIIQNISEPKEEKDVTNKKYVDDVFGPMYVKYSLSKKAFKDTAEDLTKKHDIIENYVNEDLTLRIDKVEQSVNNLSLRIDKIKQSVNNLTLNNNNNVNPSKVTMYEIFQLPSQIEDYKLCLALNDKLILSEHLQTKRENKYAKNVQPWKTQNISFLETLKKNPDFFSKEDNKTGVLVLTYISGNFDKPGHYEKSYN